MLIHPNNSIWPKKTTQKPPSNSIYKNSKKVQKTKTDPSSSFWALEPMPASLQRPVAHVTSIAQTQETKKKEKHTSTGNKEEKGTQKPTSRRRSRQKSTNIHKLITKQTKNWVSGYHFLAKKLIDLNRKTPSLPKNNAKDLKTTKTNNFIFFLRSGRDGANLKIQIFGIFWQKMN